MKADRAVDVDYAEESGRFLALLRDAERKSFTSPGLGTSEQLRCRRPAASGVGVGEVFGSALIHEESVVPPRAFAGARGPFRRESFRRGFGI